MQLRINYAIKKFGKEPFRDNTITKNEKLAILKKFLLEQQQVDEDIPYISNLNLDVN